MMRDIVKFKQPKFKTLPTEITPQVISRAIIPLKLEEARRALAKCDLKELLGWKDTLAALAAAAKAARMPELARDVNRVHKEAIFTMGELLLRYSGKAVYKGLEKNTQVGRTDKRHLTPHVPKMGLGERQTIANSLGLPGPIVSNATRLASVSKTVREQILNNDNVPPNPTRMVRFVPRLSERGKVIFTDAARAVIAGADKNGKSSNIGLGVASRALRQLPMGLIMSLSPEEKIRAKGLVFEMQTILDEIDHLLGAA